MLQNCPKLVSYPMLDHLPLYGFFFMQQFLRYLFHIQIYNSRDFKKSATLYVVSSHFYVELYIAQ